MAAGVLALGIGAMSAIFSVVDPVLIRPLPFNEPSKLVMLWENARGNPRNRVSPLKREFSATGGTTRNRAPVISPLIGSLCPYLSDPTDRGSCTHSLPGPVPSRNISRLLPGIRG